MGVFDIFTKKHRDSRPQPQPEQASDPRLDYTDPEEWNFWSCYVESLDLKDTARLNSALEKREEALNGIDIFHAPPGLTGMGHHNLAILYMYHLGFGQKAAESARRSLDESAEKDFIAYSDSHKDEIPFGAHLECLQTAAMTASSYEEALDYTARGEALYGGIFETKRKEIEAFRKDYPRYADYQRQTSLLYYSRVSADEDQGDYAPAMSLLQLMIDRAEEPAYDLSYEEFVDILDDYGTISAMYLLKKARELGGTKEDFVRELAFIADEPLKRIASFMPDCEPGDKPKFDNIINALRTLPGVAERDAFAPFR